MVLGTFIIWYLVWCKVLKKENNIQTYKVDLLFKYTQNSLVLRIPCDWKTQKPFTFKRTYSQLTLEFFHSWIEKSSISWSIATVRRGSQIFIRFDQGFSRGWNRGQKLIFHKIYPHCLGRFLWEYQLTYIADPTSRCTEVRFRWIVRLTGFRNFIMCPVWVSGNILEKCF